ncbi:hypothetical protein A9Z40_01905 [Microbacterium arborescens]|uniref:Uncharacterized protein n=1 Tax=Microbacterium arborescens TaxID=33883 RepID=A0ABX2WKA1_9MICO|nr:hypothetical protein [Microbacterium arborescens]OAZ41456.1 hypothetical protein A9Z40_01905 [Microbacterium arborescens]
MTSELVKLQPAASLVGANRSVVDLGPQMRAERRSLDHIAAVLSVGKSTVATALVKADQISRTDASGRALS